MYRNQNQQQYMFPQQQIPQQYANPYSDNQNVDLETSSLPTYSNNRYKDVGVINEVEPFDYSYKEQNRYRNPYSIFGQLQNTPLQQQNGNEGFLNKHPIVSSLLTSLLNNFYPLTEPLASGLNTGTMLSQLFTSLGDKNQETFAPPPPNYRHKQVYGKDYMT